jgi:hypothetical protein
MSNNNSPHGEEVRSFDKAQDRAVSNPHPEERTKCASRRMATRRGLAWGRPSRRRAAHGSSELVIFLKLQWTALAFVIDSEPVV